MNVYSNRIYNKERKKSSGCILKQILCRRETTRNEASRASLLLSDVRRERSKTMGEVVKALCLKGCSMEEQDGDSRDRQYERASASRSLGGGQGLIGRAGGYLAKFRAFPVERELMSRRLTGRTKGAGWWSG